MIQELKKYYTEPLYRNSIAIMLNMASTSFFGLLFWIIASHTISAKDLGLSVAIMSVASIIINFSKLGLDSSLIRYIPKSENKNGMYTTIVVFTSIITFIITIILLVNIQVISPSLIFLRENIFYFLIFTTYVMVMLLCGIQNTTIVAMRRADLSFIQNLILALRIPIQIIIAAMGVFSIILSLEISYILTIIFGAYLLYIMGINFNISKLNLNTIKETFKYSIGNYTAGIFMNLPATVIPIIILNLLGAEDNAFFYIAYSIATMLFIIPNAVSISLLVEGSHESPLKDNIIKSLKLVYFVLIPILFVIIIFGDKILLIFGSEYSNQSSFLLRLLSLSSIFSAMISIYISKKNIEKDVISINCISFILTSLTIGLGFIFINNFGLIGVGYSWIISNVITCIIVIVTDSSIRRSIREVFIKFYIWS